MLSRFTLCISTLLSSTLIIAQNDSASQDAYLGVTYHHVSEEKAEKLNFENTQGAFVAFITEGSAAQEAGLQAFDYIVAMNDEEFTEEKSFSAVMDEFEPGEDVEITVIRKGQPQNLTAQLTERPSQTRNMYQDDNAFLGVSPSHDEVPEEIMGTRVSHITDGSTADMIGMRDDDIILTINDNPIVDWNDVGIALDNTPTGEELNVVFYRESSDKTFDRWAMAVNHGEEPEIIEEFEPETGI
ncbi:MAG: PDZ domain-containing protein, partial [Bacteroidota bacterium]